VKNIYVDFRSSDSKTFFFERYKNNKTSGVWSAVTYGFNEFIYQFKDCEFKFNSLALTEKLRELEKTYPLIEINTQNNKTKGYLVKIEEFKIQSLSSEIL